MRYFSLGFPALLRAVMVSNSRPKLDVLPRVIIKTIKQQSGGCLLISYNSQLLQEICFRSSAAVKFLGEQAAISLRARHADLQAADNVFELPVGQVSVNDNLCTVTVKDVLSIVMTPNYAAATDGRAFDWSTVGRVKLMGINDVR